jgi:hypothetical protein
VRFWLGPRVTVGKRYPMEEGKIEADSIEQIGVSGYYSGAGAGGDFWVCWIC